MKNALLKFIQRRWFRCLLLLLLLAPLFRDLTPPFAYILFYGILTVIVIYLICAVINFFRRVKYNRWTKRNESKDLLLLDIYICGLGILGQYLTVPDTSTLFSQISPWLFILALRLMDLFADQGTDNQSED